MSMCALVQMCPLEQAHILQDWGRVEQAMEGHNGKGGQIRPEMWYAWCVIYCVHS